MFDSWYASLANLKQVRACGWPWLTRLTRNRLVNPDGQALKPLADCAIGSDGQTVWLKGYGPIRVFRLAAPNGGVEGAAYWASRQPQLHEAERAPLAALSWGIEQYHRGLKQCCGVENAQVRAARAQRNHIGCAPFCASKPSACAPAAAGTKPKDNSCATLSEPAWRTLFTFCPLQLRKS